jgi:hypothetical protein
MPQKHKDTKGKFINYFDLLADKIAGVKILGCPFRVRRD